MRLTTSRDIGRWGEHLAEQYLTGQGWRLRARGWRSRLGEVDLVMEDNETLVFVEVRLRQMTRYGAGRETVARDKQRRIRRVAQAYQQSYHHFGPARFDVVEIIVTEGQRPIITHIPHAFMAD